MTGFRRNAAWLLAVVLSVMCRAAAAYAGTAASCDRGVESAGANDVVHVALSPGTAAKVGDPIQLTWDASRLGGRTECPATYLMIAIPSWVRPGGEGFFALPPQTRAPSGINAWSDATRLFVPLGLSDLTKRGTLSLTPFKVDSLVIKWQVVSGIAQSTAAAAAAFATIDDPGTAVGRISSGTPSITIQDPFYFDRALKRRVQAPGDDGAEIEDYGRYFRVLAGPGRTQVFQSPGAKPNFSPTGRFVWSFGVGFDGEPDQTNLIVFDREQGRIVVSRHRDGEDDGIGQNNIVSMRWAARDAFLSLGFGKGARIVTYPMLIDRAPYDVQLGPNCCDAISERGKAVIDVDRGVLSYAAKEDGFDASITQLLTFSDDGLKRAISPADMRAHDDLKSAGNEDGTRKLTDGRDLDAVTRDLEKAVSRYFRTHPASPTVMGSTRPYVLAASDRWDTGGKVLQPVRPAAPSSQSVLGRHEETRAVYRGEIAQLARNGRRNAFRGDRLAERLPGFGIEPLEPTIRADYAAPAQGARGADASVRWLSTPLLEALGDPKAKLPIGGPCEGAGQDDAAGSPSNLPDALSWAVSASSWQRGTGRRSVWLITEGCSFSPSVSDYYLRLSLVVVAMDGTVTTTRLNSLQDGGVRLDKALGLDTVAFPAPRVEAELYDGKRLLIGVGESGNLAEIDIDRKAMKVISGKPGRQATVAKLYDIAADRVLRLNEDGGLRIYDRVGGERATQGRYVDDELVFFDGNGNFDGTDEGGRYVYLSFPGLSDPVPLQRYQATLRSPNLIASLASNGPAAPGRVLLAPPVVTLEVARAAEGEPRPSLVARVTMSSEAGLKEVSFCVDGMVIKRVPVSGRDAKLDVDIPVTGSTRWITVQATDAYGTESEPISAAIPERLRLGPKPRLFVLGIGTDHYDDPGNVRLTGAVNDARQFAKLLTRSALYQPKATVDLLLDSASLPESVPDVVRRDVAAAGPSDTLAVLVSGHGAKTGDGELYLLQKTSIAGKLAETALRWSVLAAELKAFPGRVIVFLDVCHGGAAISETTNEDAVQALVKERSAIIVLSASKGRQESQELPGGGAGVFSSAVEGLVSGKTGSIDQNRNGAIELNELYRMLKPRVLELTNGKQSPWVAQNTLVGPVPLF